MCSEERILERKTSRRSSHDLFSEDLHDDVSPRAQQWTHEHEAWQLEASRRARRAILLLGGGSFLAVLAVMCYRYRSVHGVLGHVRD